MLYQREIDDSVLIQLIILYTLSRADSAVPYNELLNLVMNNCNINYTDFQVALDNLVKTEHIHAFIEGKHNQKYEITSKGRSVGEFFKSNIPVYIREPIETSVKELFLTERRKNAVKGGIVPIHGNEYGAEMELYDDDRTCLMHLSLYAGTREEAEKLARRFREKPEEIYRKIIDAFETPSP